MAFLVVEFWVDETTAIVGDSVKDNTVCISDVGFFLLLVQFF